MSKTNYIKEAKALIGLGISVIPLKDDGSKLPKIRWKEFQTRYMNNTEVEHHFEQCGGVAAITGKISRLLCIDFDTKYAAPDQEVWKNYTAQVPDEILKKCLINNTRSGGFHIWLRTTDYFDKSRKLTHRFLLPEEIEEKFNTLIETGANSQTAMRMIIKNPTECIIETRSERSYGVIAHESYTRFSGNKIGLLTKEEVETLLDAATNMSCIFKKKIVHVGEPGDHRLKQAYDEDTTPREVVDMLERSGLYSLESIDFNGNFRIKREGSKSKNSGVVFADTGLFKVFGQQAFEDGNDVMGPFDVFMAVNEYTYPEAIEKLKELKNK